MTDNKSINFYTFSKVKFETIASITIITCFALLFNISSASAVATRGKTSFSLKVFSTCTGKKPSTQAIIACTALAIAADPQPEGVENIGTSISYDPSKWVFRPEKSGFLCSFTSNGDCPSPDVSVGKVLIGDTPDINFTPGSSLPNSNFSLINDNVHGLVNLSYNLAEPINADKDQNFFSFYFDAIEPVPIASITYYNEPGNYDFTQLNSTCSTRSGNNCGSNNPITGVGTEVPEPTTILGTGIALGFGALLKRKAITKDKLRN